jgi:enamine deaminase RidA (YjgF/YER057c/UK114 family)
VVQATIWLNDIRHREQMNEAYKAWTGGKDTPVRACVEAKLVDPRMLVEISVVAAK